jgi:hypothetical protein
VASWPLVFRRRLADIVRLKGISLLLSSKLLPFFSHWDSGGFPILLNSCMEAEENEPHVIFKRKNLLVLLNAVVSLPRVDSEEYFLSFERGYRESDAQTGGLF